MKSEKGITLVNLLIYIATLLTVMIVIGRITGAFNKNLDKVDSSNQAAVSFGQINSCIASEVKLNKNTATALGEMSGDANGGYFFSQTNKEPYSAVKFGTENIISCVNGRVYFNKTKICDNVSKFEITYKKSDNPNNGDTITFKMNIDGKEFTQDYTFR